MEFLGPRGGFVGFDVDLVRALAVAMRASVRIKLDPFSRILPGVAAATYDLGVSAFGDTKARERAVDFVTYALAGSSFFTRTHGGVSVGSLTDLCGHTVAVEATTVEQGDAVAQSDKCRSQYRPAMTVRVFPDQQHVNQALLDGRAQVAIADEPVTDYQVLRSHGMFKVVGHPYARVPQGILVRKGRHDLARSILNAMKQLIRDGRYLTLLQKWGLNSEAVTKPVINGATS
jgi:polar amino acid transport system substrate-binding protein